MTTSVGWVDYTYTPSARRGGHTITVDLAWEATGPLEVDTNTATFPGFTGHFVGQRRDAVATGTIVLDGRQVVNGSTADAQIETLEDTNISTPS